MRRRALVTGASGQDGFYLIKLLLARDYGVHAQSRRAAAALPASPLHWHVADIRAPDVLHALIAKIRPDEIYNLASVSRTSESWNIPEETALVNAEIPRWICESVLELCPHSRIFQATSSEIFGNSPVSPQTENTPCNPLSPYGVAKYRAHQTIADYRKQHGLHASSGIMFNHESPRRPLAFVSQKIACAAAAISVGLVETPEKDERGCPLLQDRKVTLGNLDVRRDFGFAGDYVEAMHAMLQADTADDYVIGTGQSHAIWQFCEAAFNIVGRDWTAHVALDRNLMRQVDSVHTIADSSKIAAKLGWRAKTSFAQLVRMMVNHQIERLTGTSKSSGP